MTYSQLSEIRSWLGSGGRFKQPTRDTFVESEHPRDELGKFADKPESMKKVGKQLGSNPGGLHEATDGSKHYVKFYDNPDQARAEQLASRVFEIMGARTTKAKVRTINGKTAAVLPWNDNLESIGLKELHNLNPKQKKQLALMFVAAVATKNWDVIGLSFDNVMRDKTTGDLVEIDTGGSFRFRAQGKPKPYGDDIDELHSLRLKDHPAGLVFDPLFKAEPHLLTDAIQEATSKPMAPFIQAFRASGLSDWQSLFDAFKGRMQKLSHKV